VQVSELTAEQIVFHHSRQVGYLATTDALGRPHIVPVCYVYHDGGLYTPIDAKPTRVPQVRWAGSGISSPARTFACLSTSTTRTGPVWPGCWCGGERPWQPIRPNGQRPSRHCASGTPSIMRCLWKSAR